MRAAAAEGFARLRNPADLPVVEQAWKDESKGQARISLAFVAPVSTPHPLRLERPLPLDADALVRVSPAVEQAGIHLGVWLHGGELSVWGTTRMIPS